METAGFRGIMPALVTPVDQERIFQPKPYERLLERVYGAGVDGVYVCGQTGEGLQLPAAERKRATECAVACSPAGKTVIVHVGAPTTDEAVDLAGHAARAGAHAVSSLPPAGNYSFEEIRTYYSTVAAATGLPFLVYFFPSIAAGIRTVEQILELCRLPNVIGLKFTDSDFFKLWAVRESGAVAFNGYDEMLLSGLIVGASGGIGSTYNVIPDSFVELYRLATEKRWEEARAVQGRINEFIAVLLCYPVHPAVKLLLAWTGIDCGVCVPPRRTLNDAEAVALRASISATALGARLLGASVRA